MREESHLDDMRAAIRGDFERLAERRGSQELMREVGETEPEPEQANEAELESDIESEPQPEDAAGEPSRRSWLSRALGL